MVHMLHMDQHAAQGTSLFVLLPPIGLGALLEYRKKGDVDLRAGIFCAIGMLFGGYIGGLIAVPMSSARLTQWFGVFLMISALLLWGKASKPAPPLGSQFPRRANPEMKKTIGFLLAGVVGGIGSGMFGIGGGIVLVPIFGLLLAFDQHKAQGTSLVALIPPTGLLAVIAYAKAGYVFWLTGALLIPGLFLGGILGAKLANRINPRRMRQVFAVLLFLLGAWQAFGASKR